MPKQVRYPEHWKEETDSPEWMHDQGDYDEYVEPFEEEPEEVVIVDEEPFILGEQPTPDDYLDEKIAVAEAKLDEKLERKAKKEQLRQTRRQIRRVQLQPMYDVSESIRAGVESTVDRLSSLRGDPEQRAVRKARFHHAMQKLNQGTSATMEKLGGLESRVRPQFTQDLFGTGSKGMSGDLLGGDSTPNILKGSPVGKTKSQPVNLLGSSNMMGSGTPNIMKDMNLLGSGKAISTKTKKKSKKKPKKKSKKTANVSSGFDRGGMLI